MSTRFVVIITAVLLLGCLPPLAGAADATKLSLPPPHELLRADFYSVKTVVRPRAVLVLCPGCNDSGEGMVKKPAWQDFARRHDLGLIGISFASEMEVLAGWRGYHIAGLLIRY